MRALYSRLIGAAAGLCLAAGLLCACGEDNPDKPGGGDNGNGKETEEIPITEISTLRVMSFNILREDLPKGEGNEKYRWPARREACLAMIAARQPMVFGLQECSWTERRHILASNDLFGVVGVAVDGQKSGYTDVSSNPIFWRKDILEKEEWGTFWLSDTPNVTGSITWNGIKPRTCTWARFKVRCNGKRFFYFNAHVENAAGEETKEKSIALIIERMQTANPSGAVPMIFGGDMNSVSTAAALKAMMDYLEHAPTYCASTDTGRTLNSFKETGGSAIDHLFYSRNLFNGIKFYVDRSAYAGVTYISDHYPIFCELEFN